jgi:hypothetical protein
MLGVQLLLPYPYSTSLDLRLALFPRRRSRLGARAWAQRASVPHGGAAAVAVARLRP